MDKTITLRLKKKNLKINATLSAIFGALSLNPVKTIAQIAEKAKESPYNVFYIDLISKDDGSYSLQLRENPDTFHLKQLAKNGLITQNSLTEYAKATLHKSSAITVDQRVRQLKGIIKSFNL
jgi:ribosomal protein L11